MKKILLSLCTILVLCNACSMKNDTTVYQTNEVPSTTENVSIKTDIKLAGLQGPTSMGLAKLLTDAKENNTKNNYEFSIYSQADQLTPDLVKGNIDLACVPANLASILYNNTNKAIQVLNINTLGVIYVVERNNAITNIQDLKGKTVYVSGKGQTPEYSFRFILKKNNIDPDKDIDMQFMSEHSEIVSKLKEDKNAIALLPQPFVTIASTTLNDLNVSLDLTKEWEKVDSSKMITGVLVGRKEFIDNNKEAIKTFLSEYKSSIEYVNQNVDDAAKMIGDLDIFKEAIAKKALPYCNIYYEDNNEMKNDLSGYFKSLFDENPKSIGGTMPSDDIYFIY
ncbi:MAG: ABC transporter substrate-binding protein [Eubacteriales bacterium]|nr:ABC transporter substrate-binding protein [Eubacteriales bacterium]